MDMSERTRSDAAITRFRSWREEYRHGLKPSALEDVGQLAARLDLTHSHPSGIAQLFASGHAPLESLFRDTGVLRAACRQLERVCDDQAAKSRISGVAELSLVVGIAKWKGNAVPVLLYPVQIADCDQGMNGKTVIRFISHARLNPTFISMMYEQHIELDEAQLFDGSNYDSGTPETSAVFDAISSKITGVFSDFDIDRIIVLGCFVDPSSQILLESQRIIAQLDQGPSGNVILDALAGDEQSIKTLHDGENQKFSPFDADPHTEFEIGDVGNAVRYAANVAAAGHSLFVDSAAGNDTAEQAAAIASRCVMNGRSVLYVPCVAEQKRRFTQVMNAGDLGGQLLDMADEQADADIDRQLISAVGFQPGAATSHFDQLADELVGVRSRLTRYLGDLHGVSQQWGVSAYQTIQNLASIAQLPSHPATRVRLGKSTAQSLRGHLDEWAKKLEAAGQLGEFSIGPQDTAWYKASIFSEDEAVGTYRRVVNVLQKLLPLTREQVATTVQTCGFPVPGTIQEWTRQVGVLKNLRRVLDVFQPEIFERDITSMIEASKSKADRKSEGSSMGFWERRRFVKEAKSLLRVGAQVESLHDALIVVSKQSQQWRMFVPHGGWPVLPSKLDAIVETQDALMRDVTALDAVLATTVQGGDLEALDFNDLESRLTALHDDHLALDTLPGRCRLEREFHKIGLHDLVDDLRARHVGQDAVEAELQLSWWTTVFEDIVHSSAIISNQDGSAMQAAADRFSQVDMEHVQSIGPMVQQEAMRRLCDLLFSRTQEANQLHTVLAGPSHVSVNRIARDHPRILAASKPVLMATPATLAALTDAVALADVAIVDACAHLPSIQLLTIASRARQIVVIAHGRTITSPGIQALVDVLPSVEVRARPVHRAPRLSGFLESQGYGDVRYDVSTQDAQGMVRLHRVEANGVPVLSTGLVESSKQEIDEVVRIITSRAASFTIVPSDYLLTVVTLTSVFRARLGAELKSLAAKNESMEHFLWHVRIIDIDEVSGAQATDCVLSLCYAKTSHGRLLQQFGLLEGGSGRGMLLDALALPRFNLDIVASFGSRDMDDERLHQPGPKLLKAVLRWAEQLDDRSLRPQVNENSGNVLLNDLARRVRERGLVAALDYGFDKGSHIPLVVGLKGKPFALAVLTDDAQFMSVQSTRERHRILNGDLQALGWSVMTVWSVGAFVNPDKEVDRIVEHLGRLYRGAR